MQTVWAERTPGANRWVGDITLFKHSACVLVRSQSQTRSAPVIAHEISMLLFLHHVWQLGGRVSAQPVDPHFCMVFIEYLEVPVDQPVAKTGPCTC